MADNDLKQKCGRDERGRGLSTRNEMEAKRQAS